MKHSRDRYDRRFLVQNRKARSSLAHWRTGRFVKTYSNVIVVYCVERVGHFSRCVHSTIESVSTLSKMGLFDAQYLDEKQVKGFDNYKYSSVDTSPLSNYISHPFWNWVVKFYPLWIAPNVLTLAGFLLVMFGFFFVSFLDYDLDANSNFSSPRAIPNWVWLFISILTFTAHTLDGTDGKQARRTGSSGPTGELC
ncbi:Ethanolaminephosphotransferase 1, partial [Toxocara canis]